VRREDDLADAGAVGLGVVDPGQLGVAPLGHAVIGEPEAAGVVEDDVVGRHQGLALALGVQVGDLAAGDVDPLDAAADVVLERGRTGEGDAVHVDAGEAGAVVADVHRPVGPEGGSVRAAGDLGDGLLGAVG
jgi:hypothetical protein